MRQICARRALHAHRGGSALRRQRGRLSVRESATSLQWDSHVIKNPIISLLWRHPVVSGNGDPLAVGLTCVESPLGSEALTLRDCTEISSNHTRKIWTASTMTMVLQ